MPALCLCCAVCTLCSLRAAVCAKGGGLLEHRHATVLKNFLMSSQGGGGGGGGGGKGGGGAPGGGVPPGGHEGGGGKAPPNSRVCGPRGLIHAPKPKVFMTLRRAVPH